MASYGVEGPGPPEPAESTLAESYLNKQDGLAFEIIEVFDE